MPKRYTADQEALYLDVLAAHRRKVEFRLGLEERIRLEFQKQSLALEIEESLAANKAIAAGVTKTRVRTGLGIGNWYTFENLLEITKDRFTVKNGTVTQPDWEIVWDEAQRPVQVLLHRFPAAKTKVLMAGPIALPTSWSKWSKKWTVDYYKTPPEADFNTVANEISPQIDAAIAAANPAPADEEASAAATEPEFVPNLQWDLGQPERDEDDV